MNDLYADWLRDARRESNYITEEADISPEGIIGMGYAVMAAWIGAELEKELLNTSPDSLVMMVRALLCRPDVLLTIAVKGTEMHLRELVAFYGIERVVEELRETVDDMDGKWQHLVDFTRRKGERSDGWKPDGWEN